MSKLIASFGLSFLATSACAGELAAGPTYFGIRSTNPEQETYARPVDSTVTEKIFAFIGPARNVGSVTGDPEKDTVGYTPLLVEPDAVHVSFDTKND